jgi:hypothetical protein
MHIGLARARSVYVHPSRTPRQGVRHGLGSYGNHVLFHLVTETHSCVELLCHDVSHPIIDIDFNFDIRIVRQEFR